MKVTAFCIDCGSEFWRDPDEVWRVRCISCWLEHKGLMPTPRDRDGIADELGAHLRGLLQLCHPDKHRGSRFAERTTAWLLSIRERLQLTAPTS